MSVKKHRLFCEINPFFYEISKQKEILKRHVKNILHKVRYAKELSDTKLPVVCSSYSCGLIKRGKDIDPVLQYNKAGNIAIASKKISGMVIHPGETFSFWKTVGKITKRKGYKDGRVIVNNKLTAGLGGGICNLANSIHYTVLHSPLDVTEFHCHSDALSPDNGHRVIFGSGTSVSYNYIDYRFKNNTDYDFQLCIWSADEKLYCELRCSREPDEEYELTEENHRFVKEGEDYYRVSKIYKITKDKKTGQTVSKDLVLDNHSKVMYDPALIPEDQIKNS